MARRGPEAEPDAAHPAREPGGRSRWRSALLGIGIGTGVGVACIAIAFSIIAIPLYIVASTEPGSGLDRTLVRRGLFQFALPFGVVAGLAAGIAIGVWYGRGGRLPNDRSPIHD
jgi:hypothetical protein